MGAKKNFVLDTNIILHDYKCLENFEDNDLYIPIVVLEELDKFKKGSEQINFNAREFVRQLDEITDNDLFKKGASLGGSLGKLFIVVSDKMEPEVAEVFQERIPDHKILSSAITLMKKMPKTKTILVTKDINLRMKARALGIVTEDYINDKVTNVDLFDKKEQIFTDVDPDLIDRIYASKEGVSVSEFNQGHLLQPNECFIMQSIRSSVLVRYNPIDKTIIKIKKDKNYGIEPRNAEQSFAFEVLNAKDVQLVAITGKAGTGKTLLALASALKQHQEYKQILLARPIVSLANKDIGFLPGDEKQKIAPYMQPLFDNLSVIKHQFLPSSPDSKIIDDMLVNNQLIIEALAFIRGRSLSETFCIIDEAQNLTPHEVKTIVTRAGEGTKMVFTGDIQQIDSPYLDAESNGLAYLIDKMKGQEVFAHINLLKGERSKLSELASNLL
ncbi:MAG: PhoH family protein [Bacteroidales bacterium]|nr:PhoH family protein [Bacteroidales bacterium]